jgi:glucose-6-phosphate isomerase
MTLKFDLEAACSCITPGINPVHRQDVLDRVGGAHAWFAKEQEAGYTTLERNLRAWTHSHLRSAEIDETVALAERIRSRFRAFILVGIGGSDLGGRTLHDTLDHPFHNQLSEADRGGAPEIYFTGDTFDPKRLLAMLNLLEARGMLSDTCINVVSKSGKTGETIAAAMIIRERMEQAGIHNWAQHCIATTGQNDQSVLYVMNRQTPFFGMLPVPEGVGGRFSFASPVGLLPFAVCAADVSPRQRVSDALAGYAEAHRRFLLPSNHSENTACALAAWWWLGECYARKSDLLLVNYADDARLGDWFTQLYSESVQEMGLGLNIIASRGPTGNHSILNGVLRGPHDKLVMMLNWEDLGPDAAIPVNTGIGGDLKYFEGLPLSAVQRASCMATVEDYTENGVPTGLVTIAKRDAYHLFLLMRTLMDAVAVVGRLQNLAIQPDGSLDPENDLTYLQHGVEGYKIRTRKNAAAMQQAGG